MTRKINFGAGPAYIPESVLETAQAALWEWQDTATSVVEFNHRDPTFFALIESMQQTTRELLQVPVEFDILFHTAPSRAHFAMVPLNLLQGKTKAAYLESGVWSEWAIAEAQKYCTVEVVASSKQQQFTYAPHIDPGLSTQDFAYLHYTPNETVNGVEYQQPPAANGLLLVADMTSQIFSVPIDWSRFGCVYAGAQKNIGIAGCSLSIVRKDWLNHILPITPTVFNYREIAESTSLLYTPCAIAYYMCHLMLQWTKEAGGVAQIHKRNQHKAKLLYDYIDQSDFYSNQVEKTSRSTLNVPFLLQSTQLEAPFLQQAEIAGMIGLKGHRYVGGMRASIYNAMPEKSILKLIDFMDSFALKHK